MRRSPEAKERNRVNARKGMRELRKARRALGLCADGCGRTSGKRYRCAECREMNRK